METCLTFHPVNIRHDRVTSKTNCPGQCTCVFKEMQGKDLTAPTNKTLMNLIRNMEALCLE